MNPIKVKFNRTEFAVFAIWLHDSLALGRVPNKTVSPAEKCAYGLMVAFFVSKIHPKTIGLHTEVTIKLDAPHAHAFHFVYLHSPLITTPQLGNRLRMLAGQIDQHFK